MKVFRECASQFLPVGHRGWTPRSSFSLKFRGLRRMQKLHIIKSGVDHVPPSRPSSLVRPGSSRCGVLLWRTVDLVASYLGAR